MSLSPGTVIDSRFEVLHVIGQGGMGVVYRARQHELERDVALKILKPALSLQPEKMKRFRREAQLVSKLDHPNIVRVYAVGIDDEKPYIAMEYLTGRQMSDVLSAEGPLPWRRALPLFMQLCDALAYAHANDIIHRDIKPSNILLLRDATADGIAVKLVDFGIAKSLTGESDKLTQTEMVLGSVFYLSPGQFQGRQADASADVYSLGCTFFEVLAGTPPFVGDTVYDTIAKSVTESLPKVNQVNSQARIPPTLQRLLEAMTAKDIADRIPTAEAVRRNLECVMRGTDLESDVRIKDDPQIPVRRLDRKKIGLISLAVLCALASSAMIAYILTPRENAASKLPGLLTTDLNEKEFVSIIRTPGALPLRLSDTSYKLADLYRCHGLYLESEFVALQGLGYCRHKMAFQETMKLKEELGYDKLLLGEPHVAAHLFEDVTRWQKPSDLAIPGHLLDAYIQLGQYEKASALIDQVGTQMAQPGPHGMQLRTIMWGHAAHVMTRLGRFRDALAYLHEFRERAGGALGDEESELSYKLEELIARSGDKQTISDAEYSDGVKRAGVLESSTNPGRFIPYLLSAELMIRNGHLTEGFLRAHNFVRVVNNESGASVAILQALAYARADQLAIAKLLPPRERSLINRDVFAVEARMNSVSKILNDTSRMKLPVPIPNAAGVNSSLP